MLFLVDFPSQLQRVTLTARKHHRTSSLRNGAARPRPSHYSLGRASRRAARKWPRRASGLIAPAVLGRYLQVLMAMPGIPAHAEP